MIVSSIQKFIKLMKLYKLRINNGKKTRKKICL